MQFSSHDSKVLKELAYQKAEIAALPQQQETIRLWKKLNGLQAERPMVMIDQLPWHEMDVDDELRLQTKDPFAQFLETQLRRDLYYWKHIPSDRVVEASVTIPRSIRGDGFGIEVKEELSSIDAHNDVVSHHYEDLIQNEEDLEKICFPNISVNDKEESQRLSAAREVFDGILDVHLRGGFNVFNYSPWDRIVQWRGTDTILIDIIDREEFMHALVQRIAAVYHAQLDQLEDKGLLGYGYPDVHCTGAYSDELPSEDLNPQKPTAKDNWTFGMAQIFSSVSPDMHREFEIEYSKKWYARFGLGYYGCCEPLDLKIDIVRELPNVRKISMSPWVDVNRGAEAIGSDFVFSRKPSPSVLAWDTWNPQQARLELEETLEACERNKCPLEFILKDISTVRYEPQRVWEWAQIAMELVGDNQHTALA